MSSTATDDTMFTASPPSSPIVGDVATKRSTDHDEDTLIDAEHPTKRLKHAWNRRDDGEGGNEGIIDHSTDIDPAIMVEAEKSVLNGVNAENDSDAGRDGLVQDGAQDDTKGIAAARRSLIEFKYQGDDDVASEYGPPVANASQFNMLVFEAQQMYNPFPEQITSRHAAMQDAMSEEFRRWNANDHRPITSALRKNTAKRFYEKLISTTTPEKHSEKWLVYCSWSLEEKTYEICTIGSMLPIHSDRTLTATGKAKAEHSTGRSLGYYDRVEAILMALDEVQVCKDVLDGIKDLEYAVVGAPLLAVRTKQAYKRNNGSRRAVRNVDGGRTASKRGAPNKNVVKREIKMEEPSSLSPPQLVTPQTSMTPTTLGPRGSFGRKIVQAMSPSFASPPTPILAWKRLLTHDKPSTRWNASIGQGISHNFAFTGSEDLVADAKFIHDLEEATRLLDHKKAHQHAHSGPLDHRTSIDQHLGPMSRKAKSDEGLNDWFDFSAAGVGDRNE